MEREDATPNLAAEHLAGDHWAAPGLAARSDAGGARGLHVTANGGYGAYLESANSHGASTWTKHQNRSGIVAVNSATSRGSGGAIRADGQQNTGLSATTAHVDPH